MKIKVGQRYEQAKRVSYTDKKGKSILGRGNSLGTCPDVEVCLKRHIKKQMGQSEKDSRVCRS